MRGGTMASAGNKEYGSGDRRLLPLQTAREPEADADAKHTDSGLAGLVLLAQFHDVAADARQLAHQYGRTGELFDEPTLLLVAKHLGIKARIIAQAAERVDKIALPALALQSDANHFIVAKAGDDSVLIHELRQQRPQVLTRAEFQLRYSGKLLVVTSRASTLAELAKFDFRWFVPAVVKYRKLLLEVLTVSFFIQLLALLTPLLYQVVMDKVLVHHGLTTLNVIAIGMVSIALFDVDDVTVALTPGMALSVEIKTGTRRVIDYVLSPLRQYQSESMRER